MTTKTDKPTAEELQKARWLLDDVKPRFSQLYMNLNDYIDVAVWGSSDHPSAEEAWEHVKKSIEDPELREKAEKPFKKQWRKEHAKE